eukprot:m.50430 g.50430  ORF g.50430 m.50430 type:complete len:68 (-) comp48118_c0_seq5:68-271(-)
MDAVLLRCCRPVARVNQVRAVSVAAMLAAANEYFFFIGAFRACQRLADVCVIFASGSSDAFAAFGAS